MRARAGLPDTRRRVAIVLCDGFSLHTFSTVIDLLRIANRLLAREFYALQIVGVDGAEVRSDSGITIRSDTTVPAVRASREHLGTDDIIFVCASRSSTCGEDRCTIAWLREERRRGATVYGMDAGAFLLARSGLLDGRRCTLHWESVPWFLEEHGDDVEVERTLYVLEDGVGTCAGGAAAADMILNVIARDHGLEIANQVTELVVLDKMRGEGDRQRLPLVKRLGLVNSHVAKAIDIMANQMDRAIDVEDMADAVNLSRRQLERLFQSELGVTPSRYHQLLRLEHARLLLNASRLSIIDIGVACGFISAPHFTKSYKETYGVVPQQTRREVLAKASGTVLPERDLTAR